MSRRIALAFLALVVALLVLAVVPLGYQMSENERESFRYSTRTAAELVSSAAEEYLTDHHSDTEMLAALSAASHRGDCVSVFGADAAPVASTPCAGHGDDGAPSVADTASMAASVLASGNQAEDRDGAWLRVGIPVGDADEVSGVVVFARSADPMDDRIAAMWGWMALIGVGGLAVGGLLAVRLARWVSGPLKELGAVAAELGEGSLGVRARDEHGPREVRALARTFNQMADRTQTLVAGQQGWVADVAHQLRTPLTALRLRLDVLADEAAAGSAADTASDTAPGTTAGSAADTASDTAPGTTVGSAADTASDSTSDTAPGTTVGSASDTASDSTSVPTSDTAAELAGALEEIGRLSRLVDGLLAVARAEAAVPRPEPVRVDEVARDRIAAWDPVARDRGVRLALTASAASAFLAPEDLDQVLDNLLANAIAAVDGDGLVRVEVAAARTRVAVRVVDDGPGMGEQAKASAFRRFERGGAQGDRHGSGLGLAIVYRLVSANGGGIRLQDTPGGGLTVVLDLPAAR